MPYTLWDGKEMWNNKVTKGIVGQDIEMSHIP